MKLISHLYTRASPGLTMPAKTRSLVGCGQVKINGMGKSVKWRVTTQAGERVVRVQSAIHNGRVRLFVDEQLFWKREDGYALWDQEFLHYLSLDGSECLLKISGADSHLIVQGQELESSE